MATPTGFSGLQPKDLPFLVNVHLARWADEYFFDMGYSTFTWPSGSANRYARGGLIVALNLASYKLVPWRDDAGNGPGSDTAFGVLTEILELATWDRVAPVIYGGEVVEQHIHTEQYDLGTVPASVKADLPHMVWR